ncbi:hypothetical protein GOP47_0016574 [Adiantum capillus-veneris]|uniref:Uncharacterized protein n=1 Tax=Adiantum capillus-veneris TaxID=13818 RepID=A0A9D4ZAV2_ADICA|nr:hypothetical protein GOP47_0016574 [Adiantum capillus-veneris]
MANMMEKIDDKLHMGSHKEEEPHNVGAAQAPQYATPGYGAAWQSALCAHKASSSYEDANGAVDARQPQDVALVLQICGKLYVGVEVAEVFWAF